MKKEKTVRTYQRRTKSGKMITVREHKASYDAAEEARKAAAKKAGAGSELSKKKAVKEESPLGFSADDYKAWYHWDMENDANNEAALRVEKALIKKMGKRAYNKYLKDMTDSYSARGHKKAHQALLDEHTASQKKQDAESSKVAKDIARGAKDSSKSLKKVKTKPKFHEEYKTEEEYMAAKIGLEKGYVPKPMIPEVERAIKKYEKSTSAKKPTTSADLRRQADEMDAREKEAKIAEKVGKGYKTIKNAELNNPAPRSRTGQLRGNVYISSDGTTAYYEDPLNKRKLKKASAALLKRLTDKSSSTKTEKADTESMLSIPKTYRSIKEGTYDLGNGRIAKISKSNGWWKGRVYNSDGSENTDAGSYSHLSGTASVAHEWLNDHAKIASDAVKDAKKRAANAKRQATLAAKKGKTTASTPTKTQKLSAVEKAYADYHKEQGRKGKPDYSSEEFMDFASTYKKQGSPKKTSITKKSISKKSNTKTSQTDYSKMSATWANLDALRSDKKAPLTHIDRMVRTLSNKPSVRRLPSNMAKYYQYALGGSNSNEAIARRVLSAMPQKYYKKYLEAFNAKGGAKIVSTYR